MMIRLLLVVAIICFISPARAVVVWSIAASACTPDSATIQNDRHRTINSAVQHATGNVDKITLICPVTSFSSPETEWTLAFVGQDSTGRSTSAQVRATLSLMATDSTAQGALVTATSNTAGAAVVLHQSHVFTHSFDFNHNLYWVRLELDRTSPSETVVVNSVMIFESPPTSDIRLKHDVALLGRLDNGLGFYRFAYNGSDQVYVGVMAQEVEAVRPDAVMRGDDGYLRVFYGRLGLRMQTYDDWLAAGGMLPQEAIGP